MSRPTQQRELTKPVQTWADVDVVVAGETEGKTTAVGARTVEEAAEVAADVTDGECRTKDAACLLQVSAQT